VQQKKTEIHMFEDFW